MWMPFLIYVLVVGQVVGEDATKRPRGGLETVFARASKEPDLDGAGLILSSLLSDELTLRSAFLTPLALDDRSVYVLFGGNWGSRAKVTWKASTQWHRIRVASVSTKPELIRSVLRADRYASYFEKRHPRGAATINFFPFFADEDFSDDLVERSIEPMKREVTHLAKAVMNPYNDMRAKGSPPLVLVTADEKEVMLLGNWQLLCGVCGRTDLIDKATTENWRERFADLDEWFRRNRPYIVWDDRNSCIKIDGKAKDGAEPTPRSSRAIPELKPPWLSGTR